MPCGGEGKIKMWFERFTRERLVYDFDDGHCLPRHNNKAPWRFLNVWGSVTFSDTFSSARTHFNQLVHPIMIDDLYFAAAGGDLARVQVFLEQGTDKDEAGQWGETPLNAAARSNHLTVVRYLVEQGADMEKALGGWTPLITATIYDRLEVVQYLLEQGADMDKANIHGDTSLHWAARKGHLEVAKLLMVYGADLNARDNRFQLPIDMAVTEEIKQAIRDEAERRRDQQPRKRCIEEDRHSYTASAQQEDDEEEGKKQPAEGEAVESKVADEDQDSEPSSDEGGN